MLTALLLSHGLDSMSPPHESVRDSIHGMVYEKFHALDWYTLIILQQPLRFKPLAVRPRIAEGSDIVLSRAIMVVNGLTKIYMRDGVSERERRQRERERESQ